MPTPNHKSFTQWSECPRCGLDWPSSQLKRDSTRLKVCPECYDLPGFSEEKSKVTFRSEELDSEDFMEPLI